MNKLHKTCIVTMLGIIYTTGSQAQQADCIHIYGDSLTASLERNVNGDGYCTASGMPVSNAQVNTCNSEGIRNRGGYAPYLAEMTGEDVYNTARTALTTSEMRPFIEDSRICAVSVVLLGTNDAIRGLALSETITAHAEIAEFLTSQGSKVYRIELPRLDLSNKAFAQPRINAINNSFPNHRTISIDSIDAQFVSNSSPDRLHLNDLGQRRLAELVYRGIIYGRNAALVPIINLLLSED